MKKELFIEVAMYALFSLFIYASINKLIAYDIFLDDLQRSPQLGRHMISISIAIPGVELITAGLLIIPRTRIYGFIAATVLMALFTIYVGYVIYYADNQPCSCGGIIRNLTWPQHLVFNIILLLLAISGTILSKKTNIFMHKKSRVAAWQRDS